MAHGDLQELFEDQGVMFSRRRFFGAVAGAALALALAPFYCPSMVPGGRASWRKMICADGTTAVALDWGVHKSYCDIHRPHLLALMDDVRRRCELQLVLR